jgi:hypothetical protein
MSSHVILRPPPAVLRVPRNVSEYGRQPAEMTDRELADMLRRALNDATAEIGELRNTLRLFASMLEMLVLMNRRGEWPRTVDRDGTLLIPELPLQLMREMGGSVTVAQHPDGFLVKFRDREYNPSVINGGTE